MLTSTLIIASIFMLKHLNTRRKSTNSSWDVRRTVNDEIDKLIELLWMPIKVLTMINFIMEHSNMEFES